jgi:hypothetical protein
LNAANSSSANNFGRLIQSKRIPVPRDDDRDDDDRDRGPRRRRDADDEDAPRKRREADDEDAPRKRRDADDDAPRKRRASDDDYDGGRVPLPNQLKIAGYLWVAFGILILLGGLYNLIVMYGPGGLRAGVGVAVGGGIGVALIALFGGAFIFVGVQSINGTARDTMGNGIGSLCFAAIELLIGFVALANFGFFFLLLIPLLAGAGLLVAGVLAIMARADYLDWKKAKKLSSGDSDAYFGKRKPKRKRDDEAEDDD